MGMLLRLHRNNTPKKVEEVKVQESVSEPTSIPIVDSENVEVKKRGRKPKVEEVAE